MDVLLSAVNKPNAELGDLVADLAVVDALDVQPRRRPYALKYRWGRPRSSGLRSYTDSGAARRPTKVVNPRRSPLPTAPNQPELSRGNNICATLFGRVDEDALRKLPRRGCRKMPRLLSRGPPQESVSSNVTSRRGGLQGRCLADHAASRNLPRGRVLSGRGSGSTLSDPC